MLVAGSVQGLASGCPCTCSPVDLEIRHPVSDADCIRSGCKTGDERQEYGGAHSSVDVRSVRLQPDRNTAYVAFGLSDRDLASIHAHACCVAPRCCPKNARVRCQAVSAAVESYFTGIGAFTLFSLPNAC